MEYPGKGNRSRKEAETKMGDPSKEEGSESGKRAFGVKL